MFPHALERKPLFCWFSLAHVRQCYHPSSQKLHIYQLHWFFFPLSIQFFSDYCIPHIFVNVKTSNTRIVTKVCHDDYIRGLFTKESAHDHSLLNIQRTLPIRGKRSRVLTLLNTPQKTVNNLSIVIFGTAFPLALNKGNSESKDRRRRCVKFREKIQ